MGRGRGSAVWPCTDVTLLILTLLAGIATVVVVTLSSVHPRRGHDDDMQPYEAIVIGVRNAATRCDECVRTLLGDPEDPLLPPNRPMGGQDPMQPMDRMRPGDSEERHHGDEPRERDDPRKDRDGDHHDPMRREGPPSSVDCLQPEWWMILNNYPEKKDELEHTCPLVSAIYVIVAYSIDDVVNQAMLHTDLESLEQAPTHTFSSCIEPQLDAKRRERRQAQSDRPPPPPNGDRPPSDRQPTPLPDDESTLLTELYNDFEQKRSTGEKITVFVDRNDPGHAVAEIHRHYGRHHGRRHCMLIIRPILFAVTLIFMFSLIARRVRANKRVKRVENLQNKCKMYACDSVVVSVPNLTKEKDPAALGPAVTPPPTYMLSVIQGKTVMISGLGGEVYEKEAEALSSPRAPIDVPPIDNPPSYSSIDLRKF